MLKNAIRQALNVTHVILNGALTVMHVLPGTHIASGIQKVIIADLVWKKLTIVPVNAGHVIQTLFAELILDQIIVVLPARETESATIPWVASEIIVAAIVPVLPVITHPLVVG